MTVSLLQSTGAARYAEPIPGPLHLIALAAIFFLTGILTVITGGTALITVPVMLSFGIPSRVALATNMATLTMLSIGGTIPFLRGSTIEWRRTPVLVGLTLIGSVMGAMLVFAVPADWLPLIIPFAIIFVLLFLISHPKLGMQEAVAPSASRIVAGYVVAFSLAIYGGFFSGGYVTMLMAACIYFFGYSFLRSIAMTRIMNASSSMIATCIFAWHGTVNWRLAAVLGVAAFSGAMVGAKLAGKMPQKLLRGVFISAVALLALKSLVFDVPWARLL